ncbi:unnamed protein product [Clonostachys rosea]|uniref:Protein kinase domain-containing protein n=1 Tax=Bionectria ochroleuca TaxID=29856 RepID=A0ABY6TWB3_BIOOC|nr:unnamed protein product [Clonostachys rosea]
MSPCDADRDATSATQATRKRPRYEWPEFPYRSGFTAQIRRHTPPSPFGYRGYTWEFKQRGRPWGSISDQANWCMRHPYPATPPHPDQTIHELKLLEGIATGDSRGIQVFHCAVDTKELMGLALVAKIYDPMYYDSEDLGQDVTWLAARDYASEAACYEDLEASGVDGAMTPKYYGSWTFDLPITSTEGAVETRPVYLTLNEYIPAPSMRTLLLNRSAYEIPPQKRLDILGQIFETCCQLEFHGVSTHDLAPRNILISGIETQEASPATAIATTSTTIKFIDFNYAVALNRPNVRYRKQHERPTNPMCRFWDGMDKVEFFSWIPQPHRYDMDVYNRWLKHVWGGNRASNFYIRDGCECVQWSEMGDDEGEHGDALIPPPPPEPDTEYWDEGWDEWVPIKKMKRQGE